MIRANPGLENRIKRELLSDLDSPDWAVRTMAAEALTPLNRDAEVHAKLERLATTDAYRGPDGATNGSQAFRVRETAQRALSPPEAFTYYVARAPDTGACQVRPSSQTNPTEALFGPQTADGARRNMCDHYDPIGHEPALCWKVEPPDACTPGVGKAPQPR